MRKLWLLIGMCIILSSFALADGNYTFTNATGIFYVNVYNTTGTASWTVPSGVTNLKVLVVGAGAGASGSISGIMNGAGAGAGGLIYNTTYSVSAGQTINIYVGEPGIGGTIVSPGIGTNGSNSWFGTLNATGGGAAGGVGQDASPGGSGGGAGGTGTAHLGGARIINQGNIGGNSTAAFIPGSGGGCGGEGSTSVNGGVGCAYSISNTSITYAKGGDNSVVTPTQKNNTGNGGEGRLAGGSGGSGGSGIIIIQYQLSGLSNTTNLVYPINTTHYTNNNINTFDNFNGSIIITSNLNVTCSLNDTRFVKQSSTLNTTHSWFNNTLVDGNYSIITNCTAPNQNFWFIIDTTHPVITMNYPLADNTTKLNTTTNYLKLNISTYDAYLYQANLSLYNATGHLYYSNYSGLITNGSVWYNYTNNLTNLTPSKYYLRVESSDSHTDSLISSFKPIIEDKLLTPKISYQSSKEWGNIGFSIKLISSSLQIDTITDTKITDRHSPEFSFKAVDEKLEPLKEETLNTFIFQIQSTKPLTYLPKSEYIGHFVSTDGMRGIWYDSMFNGYEGSQFKITQINEYTYNIEIITKQTDLKFNSLGGLNYAETNSTFEVQKNLTIYLKDNIYNNYLSDFSININGTVQSTLTNSTTFSLNANSSYTISVIKTGTNNPVYTYITNFSINENATLLINTTSLHVNIYDEFTGALIISNVTGTLFSATFYNSSTFLGGRLNYTNLSSGVYTYRVISSGYGLRSNTVTLTEGVLTNLSVYLQNSTNLIAFSIRENINPNNIIENATMKIYKYIGSTYTLIATEVSDVTGRIALYYVSGDRYFFILSKDGYVNRTFDFVPFWSEYTVYMYVLKSPNIDYSAYSQMSINYQPYTYKDGVVNNFSISFYNSANQLTFFGFNATYPNGATSNSSNVLTGGTLTGQFNITGSNVFDTVNITFYYKITGGAMKYQSVSYPIQLSPTFGTWVYVDPSNSDFGLAIGDRVLLFTLLVVVFAGISTFYGGIITGTVVGLFMMCFLAYVGLVPAWFIYTSVFIGFIILIWRGSA